MALLVEINLDSVSIDYSVFPDKNGQHYVYEHLKYYCSKLEFLPTIIIRVSNDSVVVIRNHVYLSIAKELKFNCIRAIIDKSSPDDDVRKFLGNAAILQLDWEAIKKKEQDITIAYNWYIFWFERELNLIEKTVFEKKIVGFFKNLQLPASFEIVGERYKNLMYSHSGVCVEFQALTPIVDERWFREFKDIMKNFHCKYVPIISFQGTKFLV